MRSASQLFSSIDKERIERAVAEAEARTACEIVPVVASSSGRYDRPEDMVGLWLAALSGMAAWWILPRQAPEPGSWGGFPLALELLMVAACIVVSFLLGAAIASRVDWLRLLFTPRKQLSDAVERRARQVFFDQRVHHTSGGTGLLLYISLLERRASVLGDLRIVEHDALGSPFLERICADLTARLRKQDPAAALCRTIEEAGAELGKALPSSAGRSNQLQNALRLID